MTPRMRWETFAASERPIHALLRHVVSTPDPEAELAAIVGSLTPAEARALGPAIEAEREARAVWLGAEVPA